MYIKTGDGVSSSKADGKNEYWYELAECPKTRIEKGLVSSRTYYEYVAKIARRFPDKEILVFLTHSGTWEGDNKKYKFSTSFKAACNSLVGKHPNVCILAVRRKKGAHFKLKLERLGFKNSKTV